MPGTSAGARKRLTAADIAACAPVFGFAGDLDGFAEFICRQQAKADGIPGAVKVGLIENQPEIAQRWPRR